jgi:pyruvate dehydrogenase (quinone)
MLGAAWEEALQADRPVILEVRADPNVPPLPPHITMKDARNFTSSLVHESELGSVLKNTTREVLASVLPRGK